VTYSLVHHFYCLRIGLGRFLNQNLVRTAIVAEKTLLEGSAKRREAINVLAAHVADYEGVSKGRADVNIELKYDSGAPVIKALDRVSTPGRRVYTGIGKIAKFYNGLGIFILSTPKGVLSDREAREQNVGGEVLGKVF